MYISLCGIKPLVTEVLGRKATRIYMGGCNWKCPYCYVPSVVKEKGCMRVNMSELFGLLEQIQGMEAIEITGGEPTKQGEQLEMLCRISKEKGWLVKVHSNGSNPGVIANLVTENLVDVLVIDVKAPLHDLDMWREVSGGMADPQKVNESIDVAHIKTFKGVLEVVIPVLPGVNNKEDVVRKIAKDVAYCDILTLRGFDPNHELIDKKWKERKPPTHNELLRLAKAGRDALYNVEVVMIESVEKGVETL